MTPFITNCKYGGRILDFKKPEILLAPKYLKGRKKIDLLAPGLRLDEHERKGRRFSCC